MNPTQWTSEAVMEGSDQYLYFSLHTSSYRPFNSPLVLGTRTYSNGDEKERNSGLNKRVSPAIAEELLTYLSCQSLLIV